MVKAQDSSLLFYYSGSLILWDVSALEAVECVAFIKERRVFVADTSFLYALKEGRNGKERKTERKNLQPQRTLLMQ